VNLQWEVILVNVLYTVLPILVPLVVAWVGQEVRRFYRAKLTTEQQYQLETYVRQAVQYAEQIGLTEQARITGEQKKELALNWLQGVLLQRGIAFNVRWLSGLIEAAVYEQFHATPQARALHALAVNTAPAQAVTRVLESGVDASGRCAACPARHCGDCPVQQ
jgi:hypothetical protein